MPKLLSSIAVLLCCVACVAVNGQGNRPRSDANRRKQEGRAPVVFLDSTKESDGLKGPVRRIETEIERVEMRQGALVSKSRELLERTLYDELGRRVENETYPIVGSQIGQESHAYDEGGNLSETIVRDARGSVLRRTVYRYKLDEFGNWIQMTASVAVSNSGRVEYEPVEITKRQITYYLVGETEKQDAPAGGDGDVRKNGGAANAEGARVSQKRVEEVAGTKRQPPPPQGSGLQKYSPATIIVGKMINVGVLNERTTELPKPAYPVNWRRMEVPIVVTVEVMVDITGRVETARARNGPVALRKSAENAARRAVFLPFYVAGRPVKAQGLLNYTFDFLP